MLGLAAVPWMDRLLRQAGRADLVQLTPDTAAPVLALVSGATVGAVLVVLSGVVVLAALLIGVGGATPLLGWGVCRRRGPAAGDRGGDPALPAV